MTLSASAAEPAARQVSGTVGFLNEWELSGQVTATGGGTSFTGPLTMKHVGLCTQSGPQEKAASITLEITSGLIARSRVAASLILDGATCRFEGPLSDSISGFLQCPTATVPLKLSIK